VLNIHDVDGDVDVGAVVAGAGLNILNIGVHPAMAA